MGDEIIGCKLYKEQDGSLKYYEVTFHYEGLDVSAGWNPVYVYATAMTDPTDLSEVRTKACEQAHVTKLLFASAEVITLINGPVDI